MKTRLQDKGPRSIKFSQKADSIEQFSSTGAVARVPLQSIECKSVTSEGKAPGELQNNLF